MCKRVAKIIIITFLGITLDKTGVFRQSRAVMKKVFTLIISVFLTIPASMSGQEEVVEVVEVVAAEAPLTVIRAVDGRQFERVEVLKHDPDGLMFRHSKGMAKIPFADLPEEIQKRFGYQPETAAAFVKEHVEAEKAAKEKAAKERAETRERRAQEKALELQIQWMRQQAAAAAAGSEGLIIPGFADFGVPTFGYGLGGELFPELGHGKGVARRIAQWNRDRLFPDFSTTKTIGPNAPLYNGAVTNSNVRPFSTFGGYRYPTELAVRAGSPVVGHRYGAIGHRPAVSPGYPPIMRPMPAPAHRRLVPANSAGAHVGGTGTLMQGGSNRISHR